MSNKKWNVYVVAILAASFWTSCNVSGQQITMTISAEREVFIYMAGSEAVTIKWDDGSKKIKKKRKYKHKAKYMYDDVPYEYSCKYRGKSVYTVTITGKDITYLDCGDKNIKDVSRYSGKDTVYRRRNELIDLNIGNSEALTYLNCSENKLTCLDVSKNTALQYLNCEWNKLTSLDVGNNTALQYLNCRMCNLTSLDVSKNTALQTLDCNFNPLINLDVSKNTALQRLFFRSNNLTSIDVSNNTALKHLICYNNNLTILDVSKNMVLQSLNCGMNELTSLDVSNNTALRRLNVSSNKFSAAALDALFEMLPNNDTADKKIILIANNPGTDDCNKQIAENKGWTVEY